MLPKFFNIFAILFLIICTTLEIGQCFPMPRVNEQQFPMANIPQYHCLRYFKHDLLMMRRCRHLHVPTAPRQGEVKKLYFE